MKNIALMALSTLLFTSLSFATETKPVSPSSRLPDKIICTAKASDKNAQRFEISKLNTDSPESNISDTSLLEASIENSYLVKLSFSNECDNAYGLVLMYSDLVKLKSKQLKKVTGLMNYFNSDLTGDSDSDADVSETVSIECHL